MNTKKLCTILVYLLPLILDSYIVIYSNLHYKYTITAGRPQLQLQSINLAYRYHNITSVSVKFVFAWEICQKDDVLGW